MDSEKCTRIQSNALKAMLDETEALNPKLKNVVLYLKAELKFNLDEENELPLRLVASIINLRTTVAGLSPIMTSDD